MARLESRIVHVIHQVGPVPQGQADEAGAQLNNIKTQGLRVGMEGGGGAPPGGQTERHCLGLVQQFGSAGLERAVQTHCAQRLTTLHSCQRQSVRHLHMPLGWVALTVWHTQWVSLSDPPPLTLTASRYEATCLGPAPPPNTRSMAPPVLTYACSASTAVTKSSPVAAS